MGVLSIACMLMSASLTQIGGDEAACMSEWARMSDDMARCFPAEEDAMIEDVQSRCQGTSMWTEDIKASISITMAMCTDPCLQALTTLGTNKTCSAWIASSFAGITAEAVCNSPDACKELFCAVASKCTANKPTALGNMAKDEEWTAGYTEVSAAASSCCSRKMSSGSMPTSIGHWWLATTFSAVLLGSLL
eukprot:gnl/TRDRNA2_/TRDRNA2_39155_c0_seq1.p1 gnl/TRDRNA2_/TRDRNA2_39155_c0~~gnl/TRDRNA2_/TRDRNA2_39155_c0_seq1.p1  ORF type:complete len:191 (+),score=38.42 gnl/TRDRNA2_/TRDRNA2_39155_c0_seq1:216-788(+)